MDGPEQMPGPSDAGSKSLKRTAQKTPLQKEVLEASFQLNAFPGEDFRRVLGERIALTEQQVQAWFINRRRKDKKQDPGGDHAAEPHAQPARKAPPLKKGTPPPRAVPPARFYGGGDHANGIMPSEDGLEDEAELIEAAKCQIPGYREDGPELGWLFDEPPRSEVSLPAGHRKPIVFGQHVAEFAGGSAADDVDGDAWDGQPRKGRGEERWEREKAKEDAKRQKEAEKLRLAAEREAKKAELLKEKERKAEEKKKALEDKKREKDMAKAMASQDKQLNRRVNQWYGGGPPDDLDLEWEGLLAAAGLSDADHVTEAPDPVSASLTGHRAVVAAVAPGAHVIPRPPFPPLSLGLRPAFPPELGDQLGGELLTAWSFFYSFSDVLGVAAPPLDDLVDAVVGGGESGILPALHIALLRLLQADMEEAYAAGAAMSSGPGNFIDRALAFYGSMLEEAWGWGLDVDTWRAHLSCDTWPEVLRQVAIIAGAGPKRIKPQQGSKPKMGVEGEDVVQSATGEVTLRIPSRFGGGTMKAAAWLVLAEAGPAGLLVSDIAYRMQKQGLRDLKTTKTPEASLAGAMSRDALFVRVAPSTFALQSVITHQRKLLSRQQPAKDAPSAANAAPATPGRDVAASPGPPGAASSNGVTAASSAPGSSKPEDGAAAEAGGAAPGPAAAGKEANDEDGEYSESDDDEEEAEGGAGRRAAEEAPWLKALMNHDYDSLSLQDRVGALSFLISMVVDGPTVRAKLDDRTEQSVKLKKALQEAKSDRKKRLPDVPGRPRVHFQHGDMDPNGEAGGAGGLLQDAFDGSDVVMGEPGGGEAGESARHTPEPAGDEQAASAHPFTSGLDDDEDDEQRRQQQLAEALRKVDDENQLRIDPLGLDRRYNRYWMFTPLKQTSPPEASAGRIFVEDGRDGSWKLLNQAEQLDALIAALDIRGAREMELSAELERRRELMAPAMPAPLLQLRQQLQWRRPDGAAARLAEHRLQAEHYLPPGWRYEGRGEAGCDRRLAELKLRMRQLEAALPTSAVIAGEFDRDRWLERVAEASSAQHLRSCLGELEAALIPGFLAKEYVRIPRVVQGVFVSEPAGSETNALPPEEVGTSSQAPAAPAAVEEHLSWLPPTFSAVALRLASLDASLLFDPASGCTGRDRLAGYRYVLRPPVLAPNQPEPGPLNGLESATLTAQVTAYGKIRPTTFMPHLPGNIMCSPQRDFSLPDLEDLRRTAEQLEAGALLPGGTAQQPWLQRNVLTVRVGAGKVKAGSKAVPATASASAAKKGKSGSRSAAAKSQKSKKKSALARELEAEDSDKDYGDDYDDGLSDVIDEPKYAYNTTAESAPRIGRTIRIRAGPGQPYPDDD